MLRLICKLLGHEYWYFDKYKKVWMDLSEVTVSGSVNYPNFEKRRCMRCGL